MSQRILHIGVVTDEVARNLEEALAISASWGLSRFELRMGGAQRFPNFAPDEIVAVEEAIRAGGQITAVSPGIFKGHSDDEARLQQELDETLPRSIELAARFDCPLLIVFGFERYTGEPDADRTRAMQAFDQAAGQAAAAGMTVAIENEPDFWIDQPAASAAMLEEIGHPALRLNWDPANLHWGGRLPTYDDFRAVRPLLANLHVKDYYPARPEAPWMPVGEGDTPWDVMLPWIVAETDLPHVTLETHCEPLRESSHRSLNGIRRILAAMPETASRT